MVNWVSCCDKAGLSEACDSGRDKTLVAGPPVTNTRSWAPSLLLPSVLGGMYSLIGGVKSSGKGKSSIILLSAPEVKLVLPPLVSMLESPLDGWTGVKEGSGTGSSAPCVESPWTEMLSPDWMVLKVPEVAGVPAVPPWMRTGVFWRLSLGRLAGLE